MGAAFFLWDRALKKGDPRSIGNLAYLTPLLSTLALVAFAGATLAPTSFLAMALILAGACVVVAGQTVESAISGLETAPRL